MQYKQYCRYVFKVYVQTTHNKSELFAQSHSEEVPIFLTMEPATSAAASPSKMETVILGLLNALSDDFMARASAAAIVDLLRIELVSTASNYGWQMVKIEISETFMRSYIVDFLPDYTAQQSEYPNQRDDMAQSHKTLGATDLSYDEVTTSVQDEVSKIIKRMEG